jgi:excisionase family DNA binding protein
MQTENTRATRRLLRAEDVARLLGVTTFAVYRMARERRIGGVVRLGRSVRFHEDALDEWLRSGGTPSCKPIA